MKHIAILLPALVLALLMATALPTLAEPPLPAVPDTAEAPSNKALAESAAPEVTPAVTPDLSNPDYKTLTAMVRDVRPLYTASGEPMEGRRSLWVMLDNNGGEAVLSMTDEVTIVTGKAAADIAPGDKVAFTYDTRVPVVMIYPPRYTPVVVEIVF